MKERKTLLFNNATVKSLLSLGECIDVMEAAFKAYSDGRVLKPDLLHVDAINGEFHIKTGGVMDPKPYFGLKSNGGFFMNKRNYGLPNIQGLIILQEADTGTPVAIFESGEITLKRTGALTALGVRHLSRVNSKVATICGCGVQGRVQLQALMEVRRIKRVFAYDLNYEQSVSFSHSMSKFLSTEVIAVKDLEGIAIQSDIIITCTPSKNWFLRKNHVREGTFIAAVGADSPDKQELEPSLLSGNKLVVDFLNQCISVGETHHAIDAGLIRPQDVYSEISSIISNKKPGRENDNEIIVFDITGSGLQDAAAAAYVYERGLNAGMETFFKFWD